MNKKTNYQVWFCPGSVDLYGKAEIDVVTSHCRQIVEGLNKDPEIIYEVVLKETLISDATIRKVFRDANNDDNCIGIIAWMHMFSPAKSWMGGLKDLKKPLLHLHTQFNESLPFDTIDMGFININQSAHGDREFAYALTRMGIERKTVVGHWASESVHKKIGEWMQTACAIAESKSLRILRLSDNMKNVADTEGDKLDAQLKLGWVCDYMPLSEAVGVINQVKKSEIDNLVEEYYDTYSVIQDNYTDEEFRKSVSEQARMEIGFERLLKENGYQALVDHFGDLAGLPQVPGLAMQRLMAKGYGFAAEGDWKTAGLLRMVKQMTKDKPGAKGTSFFEDYTYHLTPGEEGILETHMLEICPSIADGTVSMRVSPLVLGGKADPARLVFTAKTGPAVAASLIDVGNHMRLVISNVNCRKTPKPMPNLPVATAFWTPEPDFASGVEMWLTAGGAHHTVASFDITAGQLEEWGEHMGIETIVIDKDTTMRQLKRDLRQGMNLYC